MASERVQGGLCQRRNPPLRLARWRVTASAPTRPANHNPGCALLGIHGIAKPQCSGHFRSWGCARALTCRRHDPFANGPLIGSVLSCVPGWSFPRPSSWEDKAMKASLLLVAGLAIAISSIAPASAVALQATGNAPWVGCSWAGGWNPSSVPCRNTRKFKSYGECQTGLTKLGNTSLEKWWYCSSLGLND